MNDRNEAEREGDVDESHPTVSDSLKCPMCGSGDGFVEGRCLACGENLLYGLDLDRSGFSERARMQMLLFAFCWLLNALLWISMGTAILKLGPDENSLLSPEHQRYAQIGVVLLGVAWGFAAMGTYQLKIGWFRLGLCANALCPFPLIFLRIGLLESFGMAMIPLCMMFRTRNPQAEDTPVETENPPAPD